jgi:succinyl-CoA synthetase beta subunit
MNIHEYQAKALLRSYGIPVSDGRVVLKAEEAKTAAGELDGPLWVVKAQIHAGGRGKGKFKEAEAGEKGGVRLARSVAEAAEFARQMLGRTLVTIQTGPAGKQVNRIYIEDGSDIDREFYLAFLIDRKSSRISIVCLDRRRDEHRGCRPRHAGKDPHLHHRPGDRVAGFPRPPRGLCPGADRQPGQAMRRHRQEPVSSVPGQGHGHAGDQPLLRAQGRHPAPLDAKMGFDGNAIYRHPDIASLRDETEEDPKELAASKFDLNYIALDGEIGCMVNGAGLAMATMDIIKLYGAEPANFLDVGGGATKEKVTEAFKIITSDPNVKGILVNIFGGIMRCDIIAEGVIAAVKEVGLKVPLVVRLEGTNVDLGKKIINDSGLNVIAADDLSDAAQKIVKAVKG